MICIENTEYALYAPQQNACECLKESHNFQLVLSNGVPSSFQSHCHHPAVTAPTTAVFSQLM